MEHDYSISNVLFDLRMIMGFLNVSKEKEEAERKSEVLRIMLRKAKHMFCKNQAALFFFSGCFSKT